MVESHCYLSLHYCFKTSNQKDLEYVAKRYTGKSHFCSPPIKTILDSRLYTIIVAVRKFPHEQQQQQQQQTTRETTNTQSTQCLTAFRCVRDDISQFWQPAYRASLQCWGDLCRCAPSPRGAPPSRSSAVVERDCGSLVLLDSIASTKD